MFEELTPLLWRLDYVLDRVWIFTSEGDIVAWVDRSWWIP